MKYKFWKISNVITSNDTKKLYVYAVSFESANVSSDDITKLSMAPVTEGDKSVLFSFDRTGYIVTDPSVDWWLSYEFAQPTELLNIKLLTDRTNEYIWKYFDIEVSNDGITWLTYTSTNYATSYYSGVSAVDPVTINLPSVCKIEDVTSNYITSIICDIKDVTSTDQYIHLHNLSNDYHTGYNAYLPHTQKLNGHFSENTQSLGFIIPSISSATLLYTDVNTIGMPQLSGTGSVKGNTYLNDEQTIIESEVYAVPSSIDTNIKTHSNTSDGAFVIRNLSTSIPYDIYAKPTNNSYNAKIASAVYPTDDITNYDFSLYANYDTKIYKGEKYYFQTKAVNSVGALSYNLSGTPVGVTVDTDGVVSVNTSTVGPLSYTIDVSDSELGVTKSLPINMNISDVTKYSLPLTTDGTDVISSDLWNAKGVVKHHNGYAQFKDSYYYNNLNLNLLQEYTISVSFVVHSYADGNIGVFSGSTWSPTSQRVYLVIHDTRRLYLYLNGSAQYLGYIREYKKYNLTITMKDNILTAYINSTISHVYDTNDLTRYRGSVADPFVIGAAMTGSSTFTSFNGIMNNFNIINGKADIITDITSSNNAEYTIVPSLNMQTNFFELPITNTTTYDSVSNAIKFNNSELYYKTNYLNSMHLPSEYVISITFEVDDYGTNDLVFLAGSVLSSTKAATGWNLSISHDRVQYKTNRGVIEGLYNLKVGEIHTIEIHYVSGYTKIFVNSIMVYDRASTYATSVYNNTMLSLGNAANVDGLIGSIYNFSIQETI